MIILTEEQITANYKKLLDAISIFKGRESSLYAMYKDLEPTVKYAPASSDVHFHNAFDGGYVDHVLRVFEFSFTIYEAWKSSGIDVSKFTVDELGFVALHHDLGKLGFPGSPRYIAQESDWHYRQGKVYSINDATPFTLVQHQSLYLLQKYGVPLSFTEWYGILIHDGMYDELNKPYYLSKTKHIEFSNQLPHIIHAADLMAAKYEFQQYHSTKELLL